MCRYAEAVPVLLTTPARCKWMKYGNFGRVCIKESKQRTLKKCILLSSWPHDFSQVRSLHALWEQHVGGRLWTGRAHFFPCVGGARWHLALFVVQERHLGRLSRLQKPRNLALPWHRTRSVPNISRCRDAQAVQSCAQTVVQTRRGSHCRSSGNWLAEGAAGFVCAF